MLLAANRCRLVTESLYDSRCARLRLCVRAFEDRQNDRAFNSSLAVDYTIRILSRPQTRSPRGRQWNGASYIAAGGAVLNVSLAAAGHIVRLWRIRHQCITLDACSIGGRLPISLIFELLATFRIGLCAFHRFRIAAKSIVVDNYRAWRRRAAGKHDRGQQGSKPKMYRCSRHVPAPVIKLNT